MTETTLEEAPRPGDPCPDCGAKMDEQPNGEAVCLTCYWQLPGFDGVGMDEEDG